MAAKPAAPAPLRRAARPCRRARPAAADSDSIAFEISDIDPKALLKSNSGRHAVPAGSQAP